MSEHGAWFKKAKDLGYGAGRAAASWVFDGNTSEDHIRKVLRGYVNGDPEVLDMQPSPLSGEWADSYTPERLFKDSTGQEPSEWSEENYGWLSGELCSAFEEAYSEAFWVEVLRSGNSILGKEDYKDVGDSRG